MSHAWANDTATSMTVEVAGTKGSSFEVTTKVAEPGPLIAMKLQAVMNRSVEKQGTDLLDIVRLALDPEARPSALSQIRETEAPITQDIATHVDLWLVRNAAQSLRWIRRAGGRSVEPDDIDLVAELLLDACAR